MGELSSGLPKVGQRLVAELLYGIQASQSVTLTKIARTLEEKVSIQKTEERLSRQLSRKALENRGASQAANILVVPMTTITATSIKIVAR